jgi:hypothetical protein
VSDLAQCPGCGLQLAAADRSADHRVNASPACLAVYDEVVGFAYQHGQLMRLHQLTVDAYGAQHGGGGTPPIRLAYSLVGLHLALDHRLSGESVRTAHMRMGKPDPTWPRFTPPEDVGPVTVLTVADRGARLDSPAGHAAAVDTWAHQTWLAWSDQHAEVAELTRRLLADLVTG